MVASDGLTEYGDEQFEITYADAEGILIRIYSKQMKDGKIRIRSEKKEHPRKSLAEAIEEKLNANHAAFVLGSRDNGEEG